MSSANTVKDIRAKFPEIPHTTLEVSRVEENRDVGLASLEAYARVLEGVCSTISARIQEILVAHEENGGSSFASLVPVHDLPIAIKRVIALDYYTVCSRTNLQYEIQVQQTTQHKPHYEQGAWVPTPFEQARQLGEDKKKAGGSPSNPADTHKGIGNSPSFQTANDLEERGSSMSTSSDECASAHRLRRQSSDATSESSISTVASSDVGSPDNQRSLNHSESLSKAGWQRGSSQSLWTSVFTDHILLAIHFTFLSIQN